jgi:S-ribosylhomocysteine lyase LuxS involved in autoinducer biosynthesis
MLSDDSDLYQKNLNSPYLYIRHAQSYYNQHTQKFDEELIKSNKEFLDAHISDLGRNQAEELTSKLIDLNIKYVYCSPMLRCIQTCYHSLKNHPQKDKITVIIHPLATETIHCCHDYSINLTKKQSLYNNQSEVKFDWSLFEKYFPDRKKQVTYFLDYVDNLRDDHNVQQIIQKILDTDVDNDEELADHYANFSRYYAENETRPESLRHMFERNLKFREFLKTVDIDREKNEKILVYTHSWFIGISTSKLAYTMDMINTLPEDGHKPANCEVFSIIN